MGDAKATRDGQREGEGRAEAGYRRDGDGAAVRVDDAPGYRQSEAGAAGRGVGNLNELLEEPRQVFAAGFPARYRRRIPARRRAPCARSR